MGRAFVGYKIFAGDTPDPTFLLKTVGPTKSTFDMPLRNRRTKFYRVVTVNDDPSTPDSVYSANAKGMAMGRAPMGYALKFLVETVTLRPREGSLSSGQPNYGTGIDVYCRVQYSSQDSRDARGEVVVSRCQIQVDGSVPVDVNGAVELGDGRISPVIEVREYRVNGVIWMKEILT